MPLSEPLRTLRWSTWLGWQIESNWADWRLFLLYLVVKPVCGALMLVCMFYAVRFGRPDINPEYLPYVYVSQACYGLVGAVMFGMSNVVITDRESYRMLKYIFISPAQFQAYFVGRGLARGLEAVLGGGITLCVGLLIPDVRAALHTTWQSVAWLAVFLPVGGVMLWACGMILASAMLNMSRSGMFLSDAIGAVVYFLSGVVFPLSVLPDWISWLGRCLPTTYWLEGMRRAITGNTMADSGLSDIPTGWLAALLGVTTVVLVIVAQLYYRRCVLRAWRTGKLEETSGM